MSSRLSCNITGANGTMTFGLLARKIFSLDAGIEWIALEEAGGEPRWAWRDADENKR